MIQRASDRVGGGTFGRLGSNAALAGSGMGFAFGMSEDEPALPRGRAAMTGGRTDANFGISIGPKMLMPSSSLPDSAADVSASDVDVVLLIVLRDILLSDLPVEEREVEVRNGHDRVVGDCPRLLLHDGNLGKVISSSAHRCTGAAYCPT